MKYALINDIIIVMGGVDRVFLTMVEEFREADIFAVAYNPAGSCPEFRDFRINVSPLSPLMQTHGRFKMLYPLAALFMEFWDFRGYDVVLTSSAHMAKNIARFDGTHICYCYYPTRAIWTPDVYFGGRSDFPVKAFRAILPLLKKRDYAAAQRVDHFIAISETTREAIKTYYNRDATVLHSPINFDHFVAGSRQPKDDHYLVVSRLEHWKRVDYAIEAFNRLGSKLRIVGQGPEEAKLRAMARSNIEFVGRLDEDALAREYGRAKAVIFTPELEYGLVPLEANAAGTPVIALGRRGVKETMIPLGGNSNTRLPATAVFFDDDTPEALVDAVKRFEQAQFVREDLVRHAETFSTQHFRAKLRGMVEKLAKTPKDAAAYPAQ